MVSEMKRARSSAGTPSRWRWVWLVGRIVLCLLAVVLIVAWALHIKQVGEPVRIGRGARYSIVSADEAAVRHLWICVIPIVFAVIFAVDLRTHWRSARKIRRAARGLCVYCGRARAGMSIEAACARCGKTAL